MRRAARAARAGQEVSKERSRRKKDSWEAKEVCPRSVVRWLLGSGRRTRDHGGHFRGLLSLSVVPLPNTKLAKQLAAPL